jgi:hypothetical protein
MDNVLVIIICILRFHSMPTLKTEAFLIYKLSSELLLRKGAGRNDLVELRVDWIVR